MLTKQDHDTFLQDFNARIEHANTDRDESADQASDWFQKELIGHTGCAISVVKKQAHHHAHDRKQGGDA